MNLKSKIISLLLTIVLSVFVSGSVYAQGVFKNNTTSEQSTTTSGGVFNAPPPPDQQRPGSPQELDTPIGSGLAILSLLSGGYFMLIKRNRKKEHEA